MIQNNISIDIDASQEAVFELIETMPNKFPVYKILETKPFFFLRLLFVDGFHVVKNMMNTDMSNNTFLLKVGDSMGPFELTQFEKPHKYWFTLKSFFFNCRTGYSLSGNGDMTILDFGIIAENPRLFEKVWWFFVRPIHGVLARKVLKVIKEKAETM